MPLVHFLRQTETQRNPAIDANIHEATGAQIVVHFFDVTSQRAFFEYSAEGGFCITCDTVIMRCGHCLRLLAHVAAAALLVPQHDAQTFA